MGDRELKVNGLHFSNGQRSWGPWSFTFNGKGIVGLVGPNGAGKSSFFKTVMGEIKSDAGTIQLGGKELATIPYSERRGLVALIPQESPYPAEWTVDAAISLAFLTFGSGYGKFTPSQEECRQSALQQFGLSALADCRLGELSSGQRQRVFLCRVSLQRARLLLLDEPTNHLDPPTRDRFWNSLVEMKGHEKGPLTLVATHDLVFLKTHSDFIVAINAEGTVVYEGESSGYWKPDQIQKTFGSNLVI